MVFKWSAARKSKNADTNANTIKIVSTEGEYVRDLTIDSIATTRPKINLRKRLRLKDHNNQEQVQEQDNDND